MGRSVRNISISKPLAHTTPHTPYAQYSVWIHPWREHFSKVPDAIEGEHLPTQVGHDDELYSGQDPGEDDENTDEPPWDGFWI